MKMAESCPPERVNYYCSCNFLQRLQEVTRTVIVEFSNIYLFNFGFSLYRVL